MGAAAGSRSQSSGKRTGDEGGATGGVAGAGTAVVGLLDGDGRVTFGSRACVRPESNGSAGQDTPRGRRVSLAKYRADARGYYLSHYITKGYRKRIFIILHEAGNMKGIRIAALGVALIVGSASVAHAQQQQGGPGGLRGNMMMQGIASTVSAEQKAEIADITQKYAPDHQPAPPPLHSARPP